MLLRNSLIFLFVTFGACAAWAVGGGAQAEATGPATSSDVVLLVVYVLLALVFSFLCSIAEAVLLSITPSFIAGLKEKHPKRAETLRKLKQDNVDRSLAAILTLNTIAHTVGAIGAGSKAATVFGNAWFGLFSAVMTLLILFLSEIIPKTIGAVHWRVLAGPTAHFVQGLIFLLYPLIFVSELLTQLIARGRSVHAFSREEFQAMAVMGEEHGHLDEDESRVIHNLFKLETLVAKDVMTPRTVMVALQNGMTVGQAVEAVGDSPFSRLPLYGENHDQVDGFVLKMDLLLSQAKDHHETPISTLKRELPAVRGSMPLDALLEKLLHDHSHVALVVDEYGGTQGLVSLEDVLETLLGTEIVDEEDQTEDMQQLARKKWEKRAKTLGLEIDENDAEG